MKSYRLDNIYAYQGHEFVCIKEGKQSWFTSEPSTVQCRLCGLEVEHYSGRPPGYPHDLPTCTQVLVRKKEK